MDAHELSAVAARDAMISGEFSPSEYLTATLNRIDVTEEAVQAWEFIDAERAAVSAAHLEAAGRDGKGLALYGLTVGVKDVIDVQGQPTRAGFEPYRGNLAVQDSGVAQALRQAGAILLGKTVTAQFAWSQDSPKTRNPWNLEHTPGASTSGSPAAVAARQISVGIGTQTTSSLLRPAAYCGVVGLKPTYGRISCYGINPTSWSSDHPGIVTRSVADAALVLEAVSGYDPRDPHSAQLDTERFLAGIASDGRAPRLGRVAELFDNASPSVREAADRAVGSLVAQGAEVRDLNLPAPLDLLLAVHWVIHNGEAAAIHFEQFDRDTASYLPTVRANVEVSELLPAPLYVHARRWKRRLRPQIISMLDGVDALVAPTSSDRAPRRDVSSGQHRLGDPSFQIVWTCFGLPNLSLPTSVGAGGLPDAIQLVAAPFMEARLLQVGSWCEAVFGPRAWPM